MTPPEAPAGAAPLRIAIGIATKGRAAVLTETLRELLQQTRAPDRIVACYSQPSDVDGAQAVPGVELLAGPTGSAHQRNAILDAVADCDVVLFLDDDFLPAPRYVEATAAAFEAVADLVVTTGWVIADGMRGPGLDFAAARALIAADRHEGDRHGRDGHAGDWPGLAPAWHGYGCNMAARLAAVRGHGVRFDERLPLYAWYEDIDFTRRLAQHGQVMLVAAARGVHLGAKSGRTSGLRLGYSQVMNPVYLARKGSYPWNHAVRSIGRHLLANAVRSLRPEPHVDRRGRAVGNMRALLDLARGRVTPERILHM